MQELRSAALAWLLESDPHVKAEGVRRLHADWLECRVSLDVATAMKGESGIPGLPARPELVSPRELKHRAMNTVEGRAALIHALAHIEFNAINLALDAVWRFAAMPRDYYADWLQVAAEEALHFQLLDEHLRSLGFTYGDFSGHGSLWEMAEKTKHDVLARMALVPRTMEARGLDASPSLSNKLGQAGDGRAVEILAIILRDEIGHVAIGNRWFNRLCQERGLEPVAAYEELAVHHKAPRLKGPINAEARRAAGFTEAELSALR